MESKMKEYLIQTILRDCRTQECNISGDLVEFLVNLMLLDPEHDFGREDTCRNDLTSIVSAAVAKLIDRSSPSLVVLKLQLYFNKHYVPRDEVIAKHRKCIYTKTAPLLKEICNTTLQKSTEQDIEKLYQKIVVFVILLSGLGNPSVPAVLREASVALQSVYRLSELKHFVSLSLDEKERQLTELMCIVAGIRLFNRDLQRGGEGIDDLTTVLQEAVAKTQSSTMHVLETIMNKVYNFTTAVDRVIMSSYIGEEEVCSDNTKHCTVSELSSQQVKWAVEMLAAGRQQEIYIRKIMDDIERCECNVKSLMEKLQARLLQLHGAVHCRTAIPTIEIYPQFIDLANTWMQLQDEVVILSNINTFLWELQSMTIESVDTYDDGLLRVLVDDNQVLTDAERLEEHMGKMITEAGECQIFYPNITKDFDQIHLEYLGFCAWSFTQGKGALIPGNPNIGVVKWNGKYFAFSSRVAASKFGECPERFVHEAIEFVYKNPEYINLLQMYDDVKPVRRARTIFYQI
ncbi:cilia- and flagella-associated protein 206 isoform X2 [Athalia rosae]|uniref:cilia- and flagella-associated protein 206 isoform X2 n=1 Tax=Athalia rosae TaxID=37344 RepID=UPI0020334DE8|nr:cilia- and flagella-associated protein 206 isoform X2 [Athalia rosae]